MKKIFKLLCVALVAVTTFVSSACSCSLNDRKALERAKELEESVLYLDGEDYQDFKATYIEYNLENGDETKTVVSTMFKNDKFTVTKYNKDDEKINENTYTEDEMETSSINSLYNKIKIQPVVIYTLNDDDLEYLDDLKKLIGLEGATDDYLKTVEFDKEASKKAFKKEATFIIEYDVHAGGVERYRQTITINKQNKITNYTLELVGDYATDKYGDRETRTFTLETLVIEYK